MSAFGVCVKPVSATLLAVFGWRFEAQGLSRTLIEPCGYALADAGHDTRRIQMG
jgi:hypothetical protein